MALTILVNYLNGETLGKTTQSLKGYTHYNNDVDFYEIKAIISDVVLDVDVVYLLRATKFVGFKDVRI